MNIQASFHFQLDNCRLAVTIYYFVIVCLLAFFGILSFFLEGGNLNNLEMASLIFLFCVGLNSFKEVFYMCLQNGVSRRTIFFGRVLSFLALGLFMALIDLLVINILISGLFRLISLEPLYVSAIDSIFASKVPGLPMQILLLTGAYLAALTLGYLITLAYYRMSKLVKVIVSVSVPVFFLILFPVLDFMLFQGSVSAALTRAAASFALYANVHAWAWLAAFFLISAVFLFFSWLLIRRAPLKSQS